MSDKKLNNNYANSVELLGFYGSDETHALSAWTSTSRELTDEKRDRIDKLLSVLAKEGHHSPFEKSTLHFLVTCDTASHIHLLKHRIGVSINAESARYKELQDDKFYIPQDWRPEVQELFKSFQLDIYKRYHEFMPILEESLGRKRAKESARYFLTYANQLKLDVTFNFRSFMHFQGLRNHEDAQEEIDFIAKEMLRLVKETDKFNHSIKAFGY